jgi:2-dehydropantoate 2-reductase
MRVLVIGAGAIGGVAAGILSRKGFDVELACKDPKLANLITNRGIQVIIKKKKYIAKIKAYGSVDQTPGNYDYVLLATKASDIIDPARQVKKKLSAKGLVMSMQDGFCEETLARIVGSDSVVGAVVSWGATMHVPGRVEMSSGGEMLIGKLDGKDDPRLDELEYMLSAIVPTSVVDNINEHIYSKTVLNACVTSLGAITGLQLGKILANRRMRNLFIEIIREAIAVANAMNLEIPDFSAKLNYYRLVEGDSVYHKLWRHSFIRLFGFQYRNVKSTGLQSLERGEKTETEFMNGFIVNKGKELGIDVPVNMLLAEFIKEIEDGKRPVSPSNIESIEAALGRKF